MVKRKAAKRKSASAIEKMSLKELVDLESRVKKAIAAVREKERTELKRKMTELAQDHGFSVTEVFGVGKAGRGAAKRGSVGAAKYANPDDGSDTWTGRGRKPNWLLDRLKKGAKLEDFAI